MSGSIGRQTTSYRQGLVLGLTMAEIMLLLVFSLLIAVGVSLATERASARGVNERLRTAEAAAAKTNARRSIRSSAIRACPSSSTALGEGADIGGARSTSSGASWSRARRSSTPWKTVACRATALREGGDDFARLQQLREIGDRSRQGGQGRGAGLGDRGRVPKEIVAGETPGEIAALIVKGAVGRRTAPRGRTAGRPHLAADHQPERGRADISSRPAAPSCGRTSRPCCVPRWSRSCSRSRRRSRSTSSR